MDGPRSRSRLIESEAVQYSRDYWESNPRGRVLQTQEPTTEDPGPMIEISSYPGTHVETSTVEEMDDIVTSGFKRISSKGGIVNNGLLHSKVETVNPLVDFSSMVTADKFSTFWYPYLEKYVTTRYTSYTGHSFGKYPSNLCWDQLDPPFVDATNIASKATTKAWANIGCDEMLSLASIAEMGDAIQGLTYIVLKVARIVKALRRANVRRLRKELSFHELQELYMNARYNLRPLYYDAMALSRIHSESMKQAMRQTFRGYSYETSTVEDELTNVNVGSSQFGVNVYRAATTKVSARAGVLTQADAQTLSKKLGATKLLETGWDLVPFSFIVDWFANVGPTLSSFAPKIGYEVLSSWVVVTTETTQISIIGSTYVDNKVDSDTTKYLNRSISASCEPRTTATTVVERTPMPARSIIPKWDVRLDGLKLLDLEIICKKIFL